MKREGNNHIEWYSINMNELVLQRLWHIFKNEFVSNYQLLQAEMGLLSSNEQYSVVPVSL
jgi:hypothetical protein